MPASFLLTQHTMPTDRATGTGRAQNAQQPVHCEAVRETGEEEDTAHQADSAGRTRQRPLDREVAVPCKLHATQRQPSNSGQRWEAGVTPLHTGFQLGLPSRGGVPPHQAYHCPLHAGKAFLELVAITLSRTGPVPPTT